MITLLVKDAEGVQRDHHQHDRTSREMNGQTWIDLRRVMGEGERHDARAHNALSQIAAACNEGERVVMKLPCPDERATLLGKIHAQLCAADARRQGDESSWGH